MIDRTSLLDRPKLSDAAIDDCDRSTIDHTSLLDMPELSDVVINALDRTSLLDKTNIPPQDGRQRSLTNILDNNLLKSLYPSPLVRISAN